jgi:hypothetical protein
MELSTVNKGLSRGGNEESGHRRREDFFELAESETPVFARAMRTAH